MYVWLASALMILSGDGQALSFPPTPETEVWDRVGKLDSVAAYQLYLRRFAGGAHRLEAEQALIRLTKTPPVPPPPSPVPVGVAAPDPCAILLLGGPFPEAEAYVSARTTNRLADYQAFVSAYTASPCSSHATGIIDTRQRRLRDLVPVRGIGPLSAQRVRGLTISAGDYPPAAIRAEQSGRVLVEWEVAPDGSAKSCRVVETSGTADLDNATCRIVTRRLLYDSARDEAGAVTRSSDRAVVRWALPKEPSKRRPALSGR